MTRRKPDQRVRVTVPGRRVTRTITPQQIADYLWYTGWREKGGSTRWTRARLATTPLNQKVPLARIIGKIAQQEGRSPGEVLRDVAEGRGMERAARRRKRWPEWP